MKKIFSAVTEQQLKNLLLMLISISILLIVTVSYKYQSLAGKVSQFNQQIADVKDNQQINDITLDFLKSVGYNVELK